MTVDGLKKKLMTLGVLRLFLGHEVLVLMDRSLLPEGSGWNRVCPGWEESATIFLAHLRVLEGKQIAAAVWMIQSALVLGSGSSVPDGDGGWTQ